MKLRIEIELDNAAFRVDQESIAHDMDAEDWREAYPVADLLCDLAETIRDGLLPHALECPRDPNGNQVMSYELLKD